MKFGMYTYNIISMTMKTTKVQTLGELRMRDTANWWAGLFVLAVSRWESDTG